MNIRFFFLVVWALIFLVNVPLCGQNSINHQDQFRLRYQLKSNWSEHWNHILNLESWRFIPTGRQNVFQVYYGVGYQLTPHFQLGGNMMLFILTLPVEPDSDLHVRQMEYRPGQFLQLNKPLGQRFKLYSRVFLEERFRQDIISLVPQDSYTLSYRQRYKVEFTYVFPKKLGHRSVELIVGEEVIFQFGQSQIAAGFEQNRIGAYIKIPASQKVDITTGYEYWNMNLGTENRVQRDLFVLYVSHRLSAKRKPKPL